MNRRVEFDIQPPQRDVSHPVLQPRCIAQWLALDDVPLVVRHVDIALREDLSVRDLFYILLAVVFYLVSGCLSSRLNKDDLASQIYLMTGMIALVVGVFFIFTFFKANGF